MGIITPEDVFPYMDNFFTQDGMNVLSTTDFDDILQTGVDFPY